MCTNPTFSRIREVYKSDLLTYPRFTHISTTDEGPRVLRCPSEVLMLKLVPPSGQSSPPVPEGGLREASRVLVPGLVLLGDQPPPSVTRRRY